MSRRPFAALFALVLALMLPFGVSAQTILNVERLQPQDVLGFHWGVEGEFGLEAGNNERLELNSGLVLGHRWPTGHWLRGFAGIDYTDEEGEETESDRYLHLRYNHQLTSRLRSFHFVQLQSNRTGLLRERRLLGSGLRVRLLDRTATLDFGTGAMYETEELDPVRILGGHPPDSEVWRMANLIVYTRPLVERVRLIGVGYVQPDLADFEDLRVLGDASIIISLTDALDLTLRNEWRYDSRPPAGRELHDLRITTGFTVTFN